MQIDDAREFIKFLHGAVPWNGTWFGEYAPGERGAYWWRKHLDEAIAALIAAPAAPQQAEPVEQIGWADEFGNLFPMGAWKPAQRTHHDSHKTAWRPVFLHPPAAEVQTAPKVIRNDDGNYVIEGSPPAGPLLDALLAQCELKAEAQRLRDAASALCGALTASELNDMAYHALNALRRCVKGANDATN